MSLQINDILNSLSQVYTYIGPAGAVLVVLSVYSLALILYKGLTFAMASLGRNNLYKRALAQLEAKEQKLALRTIATCNHPISQMMREGLELSAQGVSRPVIEARVRAIGNERFSKLSSHNRMLELVGLIAPLLGLLGTILGMINSFQALQTSGSQADPSILAGGIWEALLTTAMGLVIAMPAIVVFNMLENRIEQLRQDASVALSRFFASLNECLKVTAKTSAGDATHDSHQEQDKKHGHEQGQKNGKIESEITKKNAEEENIEKNAETKAS